MSRWNPMEPPEDGLPPSEVRILEVRAEPWPEDERKLRVHLNITPFLERPNVQVIIKNPLEEEVASIYIVETVDDRMTFTMHIRSATMVSGQYTLTACLSYPDAGTVAEETVVFTAPKDAEISDAI